jgi:drug/metabolite transporter (DMT)-like permease
MNEVTNFAALGSVAGASMAALAITQVVKQFGVESDRTVRWLVLILAIVLLLLANILIAATAPEPISALGWVGLIVMGLINGGFAGLAAMKAYESMAHQGFKHKVS